MFENFKWNRDDNSCRNGPYSQNMKKSQPNFHRNWDYNNNWNQNSNFQNKRNVNQNFNRGWNNIPRKQTRSYSVDRKRSFHSNNSSNMKPPGQLRADAVIMKIITLLNENKRNDLNRAKPKLTKRVPLPPFTGTTCIGEEGITQGFFCKFCKVYLTDKEQSDKHLLTKSHFTKYVEHLNNQ